MMAPAEAGSNDQAGAEVPLQLSPYEAAQATFQSLLEAVHGLLKIAVMEGCLNTAQTLNDIEKGLRARQATLQPAMDVEACELISKSSNQESSRLLVACMGDILASLEKRATQIMKQEASLAENRAAIAEQKATTANLLAANAELMASDAKLMAERARLYQEIYGENSGTVGGDGSKLHATVEENDIVE